MDTKQKIVELEAIIEEAQRQLSIVRQKCTHENGEYIYEGNTGNWCPSDDCYWRTNQCHDCGKRWIEDSEGYDGTKNPKYTKDPGPNWKQKKFVGRSYMV